MSSFQREAINPKTGEIELADFLDDYYGRHQYGVKFNDGCVYKEEEVKQID